MMALPLADARHVYQGWSREEHVMDWMPCEEVAWLVNPMLPAVPAPIYKQFQPSDAGKTNHAPFDSSNIPYPINMSFYSVQVIINNKLNSNIFYYQYIVDNIILHYNITISAILILK